MSQLVSEDRQIVIDYMKCTFAHSTPWSVVAVERQASPANQHRQSYTLQCILHSRYSRSWFDAALYAIYDHVIILQSLSHTRGQARQSLCDKPLFAGKLGYLPLNTIHKHKYSFVIINNAC